MEKYNRMVIEVYKKCLTDQFKGFPIDLDAISNTQRELNAAIDCAKIKNEPTSELEALKNDVGYIKYDLL